MSRKSTISYNGKNVKELGGIYEIEAPYPSLAEDTTSIFREFLTLNGDGINSSMRVDGSTTVRDFYIQAQPGYDIYLNAICFYISADLVVVDLVEFGNLPALTNGCAFFYQSQRTGIITISDPIRSNFDMMKMSNFKPSFGTGATAFEVTNATATVSEGYMPTVFLSDYGFGEDGLLLAGDTTDRLVFRIRDNLNVGLSSISNLNAIAHGFKRRI